MQILSFKLIPDMRTHIISAVRYMENNKPPIRTISREVFVMKRCRLVRIVFFIQVKELYIDKGTFPLLI
jgi:hypothetical protein